MSGRIIIGDALTELRKLPDESVNCIVTSPPYYALRDYGVDGQIGLEDTLGEYLAAIVEVFREARRVLRTDGVCWVNLGDAYASGGADVRLRDDKRGYRGDRLANGRGDQPAVLRDKTIDADPAPAQQRSGGTPGLKPKDMMGIPWRVAFALQEAGWYLRSDIIWHKSQPMPESVTDRPTKAHEYLFLLTKSATYAYDADAIKEPVTGGAHQRRSMKPSDSPKDSARNDAGLKTAARFGRGAGWRVKANDSFQDATSAALVETRNKRSVWTIPTKANPEAHFATFPEALVTPCVLAGCPVGGTVLDPFAGTGTVARVAEDLGRHWLLIELNPEYGAMAERRMAQRGLLGLLDSPPATPNPLPASGPEHAPDGVSAVPGSALGTHDGDGVVGDLSQDLAAAETNGHSQADIEDQKTRTGDAPGAKTASPIRNWPPRGECLNRPEGQPATPVAAKASPRISIVLVDAAGAETVFTGGAA